MGCGASKVRSARFWRWLASSWGIALLRGRQVHAHVQAWVGWLHAQMHAARRSGRTRRAMPQHTQLHVPVSKTPNRLPHIPPRRISSTFPRRCIRPAARMYARGAPARTACPATPPRGCPRLWSALCPHTPAPRSTPPPWNEPHRTQWCRTLRTSRTRCRAAGAGAAAPSTSSSSSSRWAVAAPHVAVAAAGGSAACARDRALWLDPGGMRGCTGTAQRKGCRLCPVLGLGAGALGRSAVRNSRGRRAGHQPPPMALKRCREGAARLQDRFAVPISGRTPPDCQSGTPPAR